MEKITRTIKVKLYWIEAINLKTGERFKLGTHTLTAKENTTARLIRKVAEQNGLNTKSIACILLKLLNSLKSMKWTLIRLLNMPLLFKGGL